MLTLLVQTLIIHNSAPHDNNNEEKMIENGFVWV